MNYSKHTAVSYATRFSILFSCALAVLPALITAQEGSRPNLEGIWIESFSTYTDPRWTLENLICIQCSPEALEYVATLLEQDEESSLREFSLAVREFDEDYVYGLLTETGREIYDGEEVNPDPRCEAIGLMQQIRALLSVKIEEFDDRINLQYEYLGATRTIYMDGRDHPPDLEASLLGHSIGWYNGPTLVIETTGLQPNISRSTALNTPLRISEDALFIERYTRNEDEDWYGLELTVVDPRMYRKPFVVLQERRMLERDQVFEVYSCEVVSGEQ